LNISHNCPWSQDKGRSEAVRFIKWVKTGHEKGQAIQPLFKLVPRAVIDDESLYEYLALVDAIRLGNSREANLGS